MADGQAPAPNAPFTTIRPENFQRVVQRQIDSNVTRQIDGLMLLSPSTNDGRYSGNSTTTTTQMSSPAGYPYFIVGRSRFGSNAVCAP